MVKELTSLSASSSTALSLTTNSWSGSGSLTELKVFLILIFPFDAGLEGMLPSVEKYTVAPGTLLI